MRIKHIPIEQFSPALLLGLCIITLGIYIPFWIYLKNREFEKLSDEAPHSTRAILLLFVIPMSWFFISFLLPLSIKMVGFGIILLLIEKYLFDFCVFHSHVTKTNLMIYFTLFSAGLIGIYLSLIDQSFGLLAITLLFAAPIMQQELNMIYKTFSIKKEKKNFYNSYH